MIPRDAILEAERRIRPHVRETPVERSGYFSERTGADVHLKLENLQKTGSFKLRGAVHKLLCLDAARAGGVVAASSGNHGIAVAQAAADLGCSATVFVPAGAAEGKLAIMRRLGAEVVTFGDDCVQAEARARALGSESGRPYVSPYNDAEVIAGQGSIGVELERQLPPLDAVYVALGGGGLIAGIASCLQGVEVVACSPERSPAMHACIEAGKIIDVPCSATLSDGTAGGVEPGAITFELCRELVHTSLLVSEEEIGAAMRAFIAEHHMLCEGSAGVALAGMLKHARAGKRVAAVICGANVSLATLKKVLDASEA